MQVDDKQRLGFCEVLQKLLEETVDERSGPQSPVAFKWKVVQRIFRLQKLQEAEEVLRKEGCLSFAIKRCV